ncbi:metal ABC transporter substrate-binding protein [Secundilactobacillus silagincola]|uniref:Metal ABC transporter substrate-binding protein n=1 Tax=Secundilactobacillus silagincola TaxID=1714681 RepID=A0A1Z5J1F0_9LACO|nr:metal ABC transporter substrate-binding protein [Secundilactobacillus silagincola]
MWENGEHKVAFFVFNKQVDSKTVNNLVDVTKKNNVSVLPVTETLPANEDYAEWMTNQYKQFAQILH